MNIAVILLTFIFGFLFILYKRWVKLYDHWKERGIVHKKPYPFVGNMIENVLKRKTIGEVGRDIALMYKDNKYVGIYNYISADLMITDPDVIQTVLIKEFSSFMDRGAKIESNRPIDKHLFILTGAQWKGIRNKVSPAFSSGKLKEMFPLMMDSYKYTSKYIDKLIKSDNDINFRDILDMYISSVSASSIYGIDPKKISEPNSEFQNILNETSKQSIRSSLAFTLSLFFPNIAAFLDISPLGKKNEEYFVNLVLDTFKERTQSGRVRDDIIQQLLQLKQTGKIEVNQWAKEDEEELGSEYSSTTETVEITDEILVSQGFIFLFAGFDPIKSSIGMLLVELCCNKHILNKVIEEINNGVEKHGELTLQTIKEMEYLDWCLSEAMRLHPAVEIVTRYCVKNYTFDDGTTVEAGTRILIPILHLHTNPKNFPEPEKFKPERFETPPLPGTYIPFGQGPRMCLARRFALQEMKLFVAKLLCDYDISLNSKTVLPIQKDKWFFLRRHTSQIYIDLKKRNKD